MDQIGVRPSRFRFRRCIQSLWQQHLPLPGVAQLLSPLPGQFHQVDRARIGQNCFRSFDLRLQLRIQVRRSRLEAQFHRRGRDILSRPFDDLRKPLGAGGFGRFNRRGREVGPIRQQRRRLLGLRQWHE